MNKKIRGGKTQLRAQRVWLLNSRRVKWQETVTGWQPQSAFFALLENAVKCYRASFHQRSDNFWSTKWAWIHFFSVCKVAVSFLNRPKFSDEDAYSGFRLFTLTCITFQHFDSWLSDVSEFAAPGFVLDLTLLTEFFVSALPSVSCRSRNTHRKKKGNVCCGN